MNYTKACFRVVERVEGLRNFSCNTIKKVQIVV